MGSTPDVKFWCFLLSFCVGVNLVLTLTSTKPKVATTTKTTTTTTQKPPTKYCPMFNGSCEKCVQTPKCLYCFVDNTCKPYPVGHLLPTSAECPLSKARWGNCVINFEALLICMGVIAGLFLFSCFTCIYCCCCRKSKPVKYMADELKFERQKEERKQKAEERKSERQVRNDEIRKKYGITTKGLVKEENPYKRFDA